MLPGTTITLILCLLAIKRRQLKLVPVGIVQGKHNLNTSSPCIQLNFYV
jgi:hypothetical protein